MKIIIKQISDFRFSIVRNPYDWLVSYYHHASQYDDGWANANATHSFMTFEDFVYGFCSIRKEDRHVPFLSASPYGQVVHQGKIDD